MVVTKEKSPQRPKRDTRRKSPRDHACPYCLKKFTKKGVAEHIRHACKRNPTRRKRNFSKVACRHCGKEFHSNGLRVHVATAHSDEYRKSPDVAVHRKPSPSKSKGLSGEQKRRSSGKGFIASQISRTSPNEQTILLNGFLSISFPTPPKKIFVSSFESNVGCCFS